VKASEAEIWKRVRRRYLTSFAGLHFENEPGLTELDAAEGRRNTRLCVSKRGQRRKHYSSVIGQAKNGLCERPTLVCIVYLKGGNSVL